MRELDYLYEKKDVTDRFKFELLSSHDKFILNNKGTLRIASLADGHLYLLEKRNKQKTKVTCLKVHLNKSHSQKNYHQDEIMKDLQVDSLFNEQLLTPLIKNKPFWKFW